MFKRITFQGLVPKESAAFYALLMSLGAGREVVPQPFPGGWRVVDPTSGVTFDFLYEDGDDPQIWTIQLEFEVPDLTKAMELIEERFGDERELTVRGPGVANGYDLDHSTIVLRERAAEASALPT